MTDYSDYDADLSHVEGSELSERGYELSSPNHPQS